jgi:hypothetical protein
MKIRAVKEKPTDAEEERAFRELRALVDDRKDVALVPPDAYWQNLLVRTNLRIDEATSGKSLSISWAARVAIPGVVAILFFFIGLHYYGPQTRQSGNPLFTLVQTLPEDALDSLSLEPSHMLMTSSIDYSGPLIEPPKDQIAEFFIESAHASTMLESLTSDQVDELMSVLSSRWQ